MSARPYLPNLLSSLRIVLAPAMLGAAYSDSKLGLTILLAVNVVSDALDGFLARKWKVETAIGQRLDHWGDALTMGLGTVAVYLLWPERVEEEWTWALVAIIAYLMIGVEKLWRRPDQRPRPPWWEKLLSLLLPLSLIPWFMGWSPWVFRVAAVLQGLLAVCEWSERKGAPSVKKVRGWLPFGRNKKRA